MKIEFNHKAFITKYEPSDIAYYVKYIESVVGRKTYVVGKLRISKIIFTLGYDDVLRYVYSVEDYEGRGKTEFKEEEIYSSMDEVQAICDNKNGHKAIHEEYMKRPDIQAKFNELREDYEVKFKALCDGWKTVLP